MLSARQLNDEPISESRDKVKSYQYSFSALLIACSREWHIIDDVSVPGEIKVPSPSSPFSLETGKQLSLS